MERDFQHAVALRAEEIEGRLDVVEREMMRQERRQIDAAVRDHRHQPPHAFLAARTKRGDDLLIGQAGIERFVGRDELAGVYAQARQRAAWTNRSQRVLERLLTAERFDRDVDAAAVGEPFDLGDQAALRRPV
jgi:hypothetical protein